MSNRKTYFQTEFSATPVPVINSSMLQRKCACGTHTVAGDKCEDCKNKQGVLQRKSSNNSEQLEAPPIVHEVLNSPGQPLDKTTRAFFETRFAHNFSKVPVSSISRQQSQSSLTIGEPADVYEQEADRIADSVMLKEKSGALTVNEKQGEKFDLSQVRVHTDARAAQSAREINALAYTFGNNIVFGAGQFAPTTHEGRRLIAHELTHVAQQSGPVGKIRRKVNYLKPDIVETDPVATVLGDPNLPLTTAKINSLAKTTPKINRQLLPDATETKNGADFSKPGEFIFKIFNGFGVNIEHNAGKSTCKAKEPELDVSAQISIPEKPRSKVWQGSAPGTRFKDKSPVCESVSNVTVYIKGKSGGDAKSVYDKVMANEMEHVHDLNECSKKHFEPYIDFLNKLNKPISTDKTKEDAECQKTFADYIGTKDSDMITAFLNDLRRLIAIRDKKGGSHDFKPDVHLDSKDCFYVTIKI